MNRHAKISLAGAVGYASLGFSTKALTLPLLSYLPPLYAQATGLSLAVIGTVFMVARLWDIVMDPVAGWLVDRFDPPLGRYKFWIAVALPLLLLTIPLLFQPARFQLGQGGGLAAVVAVLLVFYFGWTLLTVAQTAWPVQLADEAAGRTRLIAWREWAGVLGMMAIVGVPAAIERGGGKGLAGQASAMGIFAFAAVLLTVLAAIATLPGQRRRSPQAPSPFAAFGLVRRSGGLRRLLLADLLSGSGFAVSSATSYFIFSAHLGLGNAFSTLMLGYFVGMVAGVPLMMRVTLRRGPRWCFLLCMGGAALSVLAIALLPHGSLAGAFALQVLTGLFTGGYQTNLNAVMADEAQASLARTGRDTGGSHFALLALTNKLGYALAIGITYPLLDRLGFKAGGTAAPSAVAALLAVGLGLTALFLFGGGLALAGRRRAPAAGAVAEGA